MEHLENCTLLTYLWSKKISQRYHWEWKLKMSHHLRWFLLLVKGGGYTIYPRGKHYLEIKLWLNHQQWHYFQILQSGTASNRLFEFYSFHSLLLTLNCLVVPWVVLLIIISILKSMLSALGVQGISLTISLTGTSPTELNDGNGHKATFKPRPSTQHLSCLIVSPVLLHLSLWFSFLFFLSFLTNRLVMKCKCHRFGPES